MHITTNPRGGKRKRVKKRRLDNAVVGKSKSRLKIQGFFVKTVDYID